MCKNVENALGYLHEAGAIKEGSVDALSRVADEVFFGARKVYIVGTTGAGRTLEKKAMVLR